MCESLHCLKCGRMDHSTGNHNAVEAEEIFNLSMFNLEVDGVVLHNSDAYVDELTAEEVEKNRKYFEKTKELNDEN